MTEAFTEPAPPSPLPPNHARPAMPANHPVDHPRSFKYATINLERQLIGQVVVYTHVVRTKSMEPLAYIFIAIAVIVVVALLWIDSRTRRQTRYAVNTFLRGERCPSCSGEFHKWTGQLSSNHYQFVD